MKDIFRGELVRLTMEEPDVLAKIEARWQSDSEFVRLADNNPHVFFSEKKLKDQTEKRLEQGFQPERYPFSVRTLAEDKLIGFFSLYVELLHSTAWVGIGIGDRDFWSKGYGTDMMKVCLRYAFLELGMQRVSLGLHAYNTRALRSYEKAGFLLEGRTRKDVLKEGKRTDTLWMGILHDEWLQQNGENP
jgi:RimJ/RimL family protein N-acetyltransferase